MAYFKERNTILAKNCWRTYPWNYLEIEATNPQRLAASKLWIINEYDNFYKPHL